MISFDHKSLQISDWALTHIFFYMIWNDLQCKPVKQHFAFYFYLKTRSFERCFESQILGLVKKDLPYFSDSTA